MPRASRRSWFVPVKGGLRLAVLVQPGARQAEIEGVRELADGALALKVRVTAPPEGGKANAAVIALLAKTWRLPKGAFEIVAGGRERHKVLVIAGDPGDLEARLQSAMRETARPRGR